MGTIGIQISKCRQICNVDIFSADNLLIKVYDENAPMNATMHADAMLDYGDIDGRAVWLWVLKAPIELADKRPQHMTEVH